VSFEAIANRIVLRFLARLPGETHDEIPDSSIHALRDAIRDAIRKAVEEEREACAEIAESRPLEELVAESPSDPAVRTLPRRPGSTKARLRHKAGAMGGLSAGAMGRLVRPCLRPGGTP
jgi:hypothetical protein